MDEAEITTSNFMPRDLIEIICILERGEKCHSYKITQKRNYFTLVTKGFPAKNGESTPLKNNASGQQAASHQDKKEVSSQEKLPNRKRKRRKNKSSTRASNKHTDKKMKDSSNVKLAVLCIGQDFWGTQVSLHLTFRGTFTNSGGHTKSFKFLPVKLNSYPEISVLFFI